MPRNLLTHHNRLRAAASAEIERMLREVIEAIVMHLPPVSFHMLAKYDPVHCKSCTSQWMGRSIEVIDDLLARI